jgi:hypothetical protein
MSALILLETTGSTYDLAIAYRIYPELAAPARKFAFHDDKFRLSEVCLRSFKQSLGNLRVKIWVLLDGCPDKYANLFRKYFDSHDLVLIPLQGLGNQATFAKQIDILLQQDDCDLVYFAEDDYFYHTDQFACMIDFLLQNQDVDFVSPYDHLDCYTMDLHRQPKWLRVHGGRHWRTAASTCLTFLTKRQTLKKTEAVFRSYERRNLDCSLWLSLTKSRVFNPWFLIRHLVRERFFSKIILKSWLYCWRQILFGRRWKLWTPIPGIATHLNDDAMSPNVDWSALLEQVRNQTVEQISVANCQ